MGTQVEVGRGNSAVFGKIGLIGTRLLTHMVRVSFVENTNSVFVLILVETTFLKCQ